MKDNDNREELKKYPFFAVIFLLLFLAFKIIQPYLIVIISAFILAYLLKPVYIKLNKKLNKELSAIICVFLILIVVLLPLGGIVGGIINQGYSAMNNENVVNFITKIGSYPLLNNFNINLNSLFEKGTMLIISLLSSALSYLPSIITSLIVLILTLYYILINYDKFSIELKDYIPFKNKNKIAQDINKSTKAIVYGAFLISIIEFGIAGIGFYLSNINPYFLLSILIFFLAFIPGLGPTIVWVPLVFYYGITGNWFSLFGATITGIILSVYIDTVLRTKILGNKSNISPPIMLIGILGGISFFGIFGLIIGPLILVYSLKILREYFNK